MFITVTNVYILKTSGLKVLPGTTHSWLVFNPITSITLHNLRAVLCLSKYTFSKFQTFQAKLVLAMDGGG